MGNHDYWTNGAAVRRGLAAASVAVVANGAVRRGPLAIGGIDDPVTHHANVAGTSAAVRRLGGAPVLLAHSPDIAPALPPGLSLLLAGHTHCGQVVLPLIGAPISVSRYGERYRCGLVREGARTVVIGAGTGTSNLPLRFNAPPDWWLLTLGP